jgi:sugar lactone lactonase YvrE
VLARENRFALLGPDLTEEKLLPPVFIDPQIRMNDGGCDPQGRFYCGTMAYDETPGAGSLYRLDPDGSVHVTLRGVTISNGLQWNTGGDTVFYVDTPTGRVDAFDFDLDSGSLSRRRPFLEIEAEAGAPDGMTIDTEDCLWVALWGGGAVRRYTPEGDLDLVVEVPATQVTSCTFGGPSLEDLFITTATTELPAEALSEQPHAGGLFRCRPGARGLLPVAYRG